VDRGLYVLQYGTEMIFFIDHDLDFLLVLTKFSSLLGSSGFRYITIGSQMIIENMLRNSYKIIAPLCQTKVGPYQPSVLSNMVMHTLSFLLIPKGWIILDPNTLEK
jgi:hypothetical protein